MTGAGALGLVWLAIHAAAAGPSLAATADQAAAPPRNPAGLVATAAPTLTPPVDYVIGPDDVLGVIFWREEAMSGDVVVRPDGMISVPLINDLKAAGLTPDQLRERLVEAASKFIEGPTATVVVRQINSRKVFVLGQVEKPGAVPLSGPTTILQLIALAGGLKEYANTKDIVVMRTENGITRSFPFNYRDVLRGKKLEQNIELRPGDTLIVP
jgi:polysaccharide export outer membrane protein